MSFVNYACWKPDEVRNFIRREALEGDEAIFLSVHLPIREFELRTGTLPERSDTALLDALDGERPHVIAVVVGEPGSGKSHLIQWLGYRWPKRESDHVVLVPRSDGSLFGTLDRLRRELGSQYAESLEGLGQTKLAEAGRASSFLGQIVTFCQSSSYPPETEKPLHADWLDRQQAWRLLNHNELRERWSAPIEIVGLLGGGPERDQETARFKPQHFVDLVEIVGGVRGGVGGLRTGLLFTNLQKELSIVREIVSQNPSVDVQVRQLQSKAPETHRLLQALDARRADAIQGLLGIHRDDLKRRFLEVRRRLKEDGKRLVLLLEDVTNLQGLDAQLIEALLPNPNSPADRDLCDLVAVVGLTNDYYDAFIGRFGNLRDRLRYQLLLTTEIAGDVVNRRARFLDSPVGRARFLASYLNAVRAGKAAVEDWGGDAGPRPNSCETCIHRPACHAAFGSVKVEGVAGDGVGLYPFTQRALDLMWEQLSDPEIKRALRTPRGLLLNVISPLLHQAEHLRLGRFPTEELENPNLMRLDGSADLLETMARLPEPESSRTRRVVVWWGDRHDGHRSELGYSGVPRGVMEAFAAWWPGEQPVVPGAAEVDAETRSEGGDVAIQGPEAGSSTQQRRTTPQVSTSGEATSTAGTATGVQPQLIPSPQPQGPRLPVEWSKAVEALNSWCANPGSQLANPSLWEGLFREAVESISPETLGRSPGIWGQIFSKSNLELAGVAGRTTAMSFVVEPSTDLQRGLTSLAWLKHGDGMSEGMRVRRFFEASAFTAWLTNEACAHYDHVYSELAERLGGDPLELTVRSLLAEAWLGGDTHPGSSELDQWRAARNKPVTQPSAGTPGGDAKRSEAWQTLAEKCDRFWTALLELDLHRVGQKPQREGNGLVDGARVLAAVRDVAKDPERWPLGPGAFPQGLKFGPVREVLTFMQQDFEKALAAEDDRVRSLANTVVQSTGGADADAFLGQLLEVTKRLETLDRDLVPAAISQPFHSECAVLSDKGLPLGSATWVQLNDQIRDLASASDSAPVAEKLTRLVSVNHAMLAAVARAAGTGDRLLDETSRRATSWVEAADKGQAQKVREYGKRLQAAGTKIQKEVQK